MAPDEVAGFFPQPDEASKEGFLDIECPLKACLEKGEEKGTLNRQ